MAEQIAIAILSFTLGVVLMALAAWKGFSIAFDHSAHCSVCKERWIEILNEHHDTGTYCFWKRFVPTSHQSPVTSHEVPHD
jgi:hypothetical protein